MDISIFLEHHGFNFPYDQNARFFVDFYQLELRGSGKVTLDKYW